MTTATPPDGAPPETVGPLTRGVAVLGALTAAGGAAALGDLVRATGLARATVDRVVATLARMGHVRTAGGSAVLAPRLMELGNAYLGALGLPGLLGPPAGRLADELAESVSLAVADGDGIRFVHQTTRRRAVSAVFRTGDLLPAERTAAGTLFAAEWDERQWAHWRERRIADPHDAGFPAVPPRAPGAGPGEAAFRERAARAAAENRAVDDQLVEPGLVALAVPVRGPDGRTACAMSVVSHTSRHSADDLARTLLPRARTCASAMEELLRRPRPLPGSPAAHGGEAGLADWTHASKQQLGAGFLESLARGLTVLTAFGESAPELTLSGVAEATGLPRATARRALITLEHLGLVTGHGRLFRPAPRVLGLGYALLSGTPLSSVAAPHLTELARRVEDSASLAVLDADQVRYTARVGTARIMSVDIVVGTRFPAYATAMGRVLLADLPAADRAARLAGTDLHAFTPRTVTRADELAALLDQAQAQGYALVDEELEAGLRSLAVPVRDLAGRAVAAVNVAMHSGRRSLEACLAEVLPELRATAVAIEADLRVAGRFSPVPTD
jgi:IclR family pca regulon transcriptional regulator